MACLCSHPSYRSQSRNALRSIIWPGLEYFWHVDLGLPSPQACYSVVWMMDTMKRSQGLFLFNTNPGGTVHSDTQQMLNGPRAFQLFSQAGRNYTPVLCPRMMLHFLSYLHLRCYWQCKIGALQSDKPVIGACGLLQLMTMEVSSTLSTVWSGGASGAV